MNTYTTRSKHAPLSIFRMNTCEKAPWGVRVALTLSTNFGWHSQVGGSMPIESSCGNRLRKHDTDGNKDRRAARRKRHSHLEPRAFRILISAAKADTSLGQILAHNYFFLKSAPPNAS